MLKLYNLDQIISLIFKVYFYASIFLGLSSFIGLINGSQLLATVCGFFYFLINSAFVLSKRFRDNSFSIPFCIFSFIFFHIPNWFILFNGTNYLYASGIQLNIANQSNVDDLPIYFLFLTLCSVSMSFGMLFQSKSKSEVDISFTNKISNKSILFFTALVALITFLDTKSRFIAQNTFTAKSESFLPFIFFDTAFLYAAILILALKLNSNYKKASISNSVLTYIIAITFLSLNIYATSKSSFLILLIPFICIPFSVLNNEKMQKILFPTKKALFLILILSIMLFSIMEGLRSKQALFNLGLFNEDKEALSLLENIRLSLDHIFYRLAWGGSDRLILIFNSYLIPNFEATSNFILYLIKNFINLILPGTIFVDAYLPSSQLFSSIIEKSSYEFFYIDNTNILNKLNTQPFTLYGFFTILFGFFAPVFIFIFSYSFSKFYNSTKYILLKLTSFYFFWSFLSCFGFEVVLENSIHFFISLIVLTYLMIYFSKISFLR